MKAAEELERQISDAEGRLADARAAASRLRRELGDLEARRRDLRRELGRVRDVARGSELEDGASRQEMLRKQALVSQRHDELDVRESDLRCLREQIESARAACVRLDSESDRLVRRMGLITGALGPTPEDGR